MSVDLLRDRFNSQNNSPVRNSRMKAGASSMEFENECGGWEVGQSFADQQESILGNCFLEAASLKHEVFLAHQSMDELCSQGSERLGQDTEYTSLSSPATTAEFSRGFQNKNDKILYSRGCVPPPLSYRARVLFIWMVWGLCFKFMPTACACPSSTKFIIWRLVVSFIITGLWNRHSLWVAGCQYYIKITLIEKLQTSACTERILLLGPYFCNLCSIAGLGCA